LQALRDGHGFDFGQQVREREPRDTEQCARRLASGLVEMGDEQAVVLRQQIDIRSVALAATRG
jgi:hypothetical protein